MDEKKKKAVIISHIDHITDAVIMASHYPQCDYDLEFSFEEDNSRNDIHLNAVARATNVAIVNNRDMSKPMDFAIGLAHNLNLDIDFLHLPF